ncbi:hypothetical protein G7Y89_g13497 [Cudoniella acicularis]|uniref:Uncharacterized protein n=1 Tax=Cudoniella acicularis TaxID=354080 RepID=A0A8H4VWD5_9HELO|nr:hypothetical protein G7Y89_g13497 [Cudoniella acicularis]
MSTDGGGDAPAVATTADSGVGFSSDGGAAIITSVDSSTIAPPPDISSSSSTAPIVDAPKYKTELPAIGEDSPEVVPVATEPTPPVISNSPEDELPIEAGTGSKSPPKVPRKPFFSSSQRSQIWGQMKSINTAEIQANVANMKIPNVDINIDGRPSRSGNTFEMANLSTPSRQYYPTDAFADVHDYIMGMGVSSILLTILGFVVGLSLSFRGSTAYERYSEGRRAWASLAVQGRNLARYIWVHIQERPGDVGKQDLLDKITAINLIHALAVSTKHRLRFEPYTFYPDLVSLVSHLDTFAKSAEHPGLHDPKPKKNRWKEFGEYLGLNVAESNPRKAIKRSIRPTGNLPYEVILYLSAYFEMTINNGTMTSTIIYGQVMNSIAALTDTLASADRVLTTPLPVGYGIIISQIVILYVYLLPFQLYSFLGWNTIPGTMAAAYIMLGLEAIGTELENPFGNAVNDLPLDHYCNELRKDLDVVMSQYRADGQFVQLMTDGKESNRVLWPLSNSSAEDWGKRSKEEIMQALKAKVVIGETRRLSIERRSEERRSEERVLSVHNLKLMHPFTPFHHPKYEYLDLVSKLKLKKQHKPSTARSTQTIKTFTSSLQKSHELIDPKIQNTGSPLTTCQERSSRKSSQPSINPYSRSSDPTAKIPSDLDPHDATLPSHAE